MSENSPVPEKKGITRRQFLKWGAVTTGVTVLASGELEKVIISCITQFLADPQNGERAFKFVADRLGNEKRNPTFRSIDAIIIEGISVFEHQTNKKAKFQRNPDYRDFSYYQEQIEAAKKSIGILSEDPKILIQPVIDSFPPAAKSAYIKSESTIGSYLSIPGESGMYARFGKEYPNDAGKPLLGNIIDRFKQKAKEYMLKAKDFIEENVQTNGNKPVSASRLFAFFLDKNEGDIAQSLTDTYIFLKFASRNNFETGDYTANEQNIVWMRTNILDEYGSKPYDRESADSINLIGKPYHSWNFVAMLALFPPELIQIAGVEKQLRHLDQQGAIKLQSDLLTLSKLKATEMVLIQHQT